MSTELENTNILFDLIKNHHWDKFIEFVEKHDNINVNLRDNGNTYLIQYATLHNQKDIVSILINRGAKLDITDFDGRSILFIPIKYGYNEILELLLHFSKSSIGLSLIDIQDNSGHTALHHSILFRNEYAIKLLLQNKANLNIQDKFGYSALHLCVRIRSMEILKLLLPHKPDINLRCKTGETALHISCNYGIFDISKLLLENGASPNIMDYGNELTPLIYSVVLNRLEFVKLLLSYKGDPNNPDQYGNTALHYSTYNNNDVITEYLLNNYPNVNYNSVDINGKTPLHIILENETLPDVQIDKYINILLKNSNINLQDNTGTTSLHILARRNLWIKYVLILKHKKLNIYKYTLDGKSVMDYVHTNKEEFLDMVIDSFYNILLEKKDIVQKISKNWEYECSMQKKDEKACKSLIKKHILENKQSVPEYHYYNIEIFPGDLVTFGTFIGINIDFFCGLIYLLTKWKNCRSSLTENFIYNENLQQYYGTIGIKIHTDSIYMNFEATWISNKLFFPTTFDNSAKKFFLLAKKNKNVRFFILPLAIEHVHGSHANYIIYDIVYNEIERFEPHGSRFSGGYDYNPSLLDTLIKERYNTIFNNSRMISPIEYLPKIGFQSIEVSEGNKYTNIGDPGGFCAIWTIWYVDLRLEYPDIPRKKLIEKSMEYIKMKGYSFKTLIRNYTTKIIDIRDKLLGKIGIDINQWINNDFTSDQLTNLNSNIAEVISTLNKN